jgi:hypothetical protein
VETSIKGDVGHSDVRVADQSGDPLVPAHACLSKGDKGENLKWLHMGMHAGIQEPG